MRYVSKQCYYHYMYHCTAVENKNLCSLHSLRLHDDRGMYCVATGCIIIVLAF